jgi:hypothetical protein
MSASPEQIAKDIAAGFHAAAQLGTSEVASTDSGSALSLDPDSQLRAALDTCIAARDLIQPEQTKIQVLIDAATNDIERAAREYQHDLIEWQLTRAADIAENRLAYLEKLTDYEAENALCQEDMGHWFDYYAWGYDPRPDSPLQVMPFDPFEFQERYLEWLNRQVFDLRSSGIVEKARDMGATVGALAWATYHFLYTDYFSAMVSSANEDLVDSKKDPDTLFEKVRFNLRLLPAWMLPKSFSLDRDMPYMNIANPVNGATITGTAPTSRVGRGRRKTVAIGDEFQTWQFGGYPQHTALSQVTKSLILLGTPEGNFNKYADIAHDDRTPKFEMDWREHPWKDERWFNALPFGYFGSAMTEEQIAQEIERNYEASQPGKVLKNVREEYCFITQDELVAGFEAYGLTRHFYGSDGKFRIPEFWEWGRISDYGESARAEDDTHIWAYSLMARPSEGFPFTDSIFFFYSLPIEPIGATEIEAYAFYSELERELGLRRAKDFTRQPTINDMSHEAKDARDVLRDKCGDNWRTPDLDFDKGRRKLVYHFGIVDKHLPNPFRPVLKGRCRIYFVAPKGEYFLAKNERNNAYFVTPSQTQKGFKRLRREIPAWHYPPEERGKPVQKARPKSVFDDIITTVRYALARWGVGIAAMTTEQKTEEKMLPGVRKVDIPNLPTPEQQSQAIISNRIWTDHFKAEQEKEREQSNGRVTFRK